MAVKTDCLVYQSLPKKFLQDVEALVRRRHRDCTPKYRFEEVKCLQRQYGEPRLEAEPPAQQRFWQHVDDPVAHCLEGKSQLSIVDEDLLILAARAVHPWSLVLME